MLLSAHDRLGPYRLARLIGQGRHCEVWDAVDEESGERRALKVLASSLAKDREQLGLLKHEFAVGRDLDHPNVIHLYDFRTHRGTVFVVMDLFAAQNLKQLLLQGVEYVAPWMSKIVEQSAAGLGYLHSHGWIHRDVKPDNFLVDTEGGVKLIDFALAERKKGALAKLFGGRGKVQGTRSYMSPEQIRGQPVDARSDIYGLGCMFYELVSGKPPFTGQNTQELLTKHLTTAAPSLEAVGRDVTPEFAKLVRKMMAKKPADRPESMEEIVRAARSMQVYNRIPSAPPAAGQNAQP
jgi:serine/threonine protein kinase